MFVSSSYRTWLSTGLALLLLAATSVPAATLDIDDNGSIDAQTDGQLILRHLFGFGGDTLVAGAIGDGALRDAAAIESYLAALDLALDVDSDGNVDALTDGVLVLRWMLGRDGDELTSGALSPTASRQTAAAISDYIAAIPAPRTGNQALLGPLSGATINA